MVQGPSGRNQKIITNGGCESSRLKNKGTRYLAFTLELPQPYFYSDLLITFIITTRTTNSYFTIFEAKTYIEYLLSAKIERYKNTQNNKPHIFAGHKRTDL